MTMTGIQTGGIGQPVLRKEDRRLLTGKGSYTDDVSLPGQAHAVMVRSPHAHARIVSVDVARALEVPGVLAVLTGAEQEADGIRAIPDQAAIAGLVDVAMNNSDGSARRTSPIPLLASDKARFVGNAIAAVIAESLAAASDGAEQVEVTYEPIPAVTATDGMVQPFELRAEGGAENVWIVEMGAKGDLFADFAAFQAAVSAAELTVTERADGDLPAGVEYGPVFDVSYGSPSLGAMTFGWTAPLTVAGAEVSISDYLRYDNPWGQAAQDADAMVLADPETGDAWRLDYRALTRTPVCVGSGDCWQ